VRLADHLIQGRRAQPFGERGAAGQVLVTPFVEKIHTVSISAVTSNPAATVSEIPPRVRLRNACRNDWETLVL
jgi:hypothetical protein